MDDPVKAKLIEILRPAFAGQLAKLYEAVVAAQAELAEGIERPVPDFRRCLTDGNVEVTVSPTAFHAPGGNHTVRLSFELASSGDTAIGSIKCESALASKEEWLASPETLLLLTSQPDDLRDAIMDVDLEKLRLVDCS